MLKVKEKENLLVFICFPKDVYKIDTCFSGADVGRCLLLEMKTIISVSIENST